MICILPKYRSGDEKKKNKMDGAYSMYGGGRGSYRALKKIERKRSIGRPRRRREDNINKTNLVICVWIRMIWLRIGTGGGLL